MSNVIHLSGLRIDDNQSITYFENSAKAQQIADICGKDDPEWTYTVFACGRGFYIEITDEEGNRLGTL